MKKVYLGSIALERNRWESGRSPTYLVSDFVQRAKDDGFDGIELWQYHYLSADAGERKKLVDSDTSFIFNSYLSLADGMTDAVKDVADAICQLKAEAVKYNFGSSQLGYNPADLQKQTETLLRFADMLPENVKLLCECHADSIGEDPVRMAEIFKKLDERFGAIIHLMTPLDFAKHCFDCYGERICHIHSSYVLPDLGFQCLAGAEATAEEHYQYYVSRGFNGTVTVEFTQDASSPEQFYHNTLKDLNVWKKML